MSLDDRNSFYGRATRPNGDIELDYIDTRINDMNLRTDGTMRITSALVNRPDLISLKSYGTYNFGWLISLHNNILDPFSEYSLGRVVKIPSLDDYYRYYNRNKKKV